MADDDRRAAAATATIITSTLALPLLSIRRYSVVVMSESHFAV